MYTHVYIYIFFFLTWREKKKHEEKERERGKEGKGGEGRNLSSTITTHVRRIARAGSRQNGKLLFCRVPFTRVPRSFIERTMPKGIGALKVSRRSNWLYVWRNNNLTIGTPSNGIKLSRCPTSVVRRLKTVLIQINRKIIK